MSLQAGSLCAVDRNHWQQRGKQLVRETPQTLNSKAVHHFGFPWDTYYVIQRIICVLGLKFEKTLPSFQKRVVVLTTYPI